MRVARVFARQTSMCPTDKGTYFDDPDLFTPEYDEIWISVTFTWDIERGYKLKKSWERYCKKVCIGGPAFDDPGNSFVAGQFLKKGITVTSRGCRNNCSFCLVPKREGNIRELPIIEGNIIQDNNLLACSKSHINKVFSMLSKQRGIEFVGGIDCTLLDYWHIEAMRGLRIRKIWLALDHNVFMVPFQEACTRLREAGFSRDKIRCYVLAGYNEPIQTSEGRLRFAYDCGALPYIQAYQPVSNNKRMAGERSREDNLFVKNWSRPAIYKSFFK